VVNFIIHKSYRIHITFLKRTRGLHVTDLQIGLHKFCYARNCGVEMFFKEQERVIDLCDYCHQRFVETVKTDK
jgi:hypothetical protein